MDSADPETGSKAPKSDAAFRTISEVADELGVAQHVLRFWESKFPQVKPLKRGGGRRYYRPADVEILQEIQSLLYKQGYTIKGAQKLLRQQRMAKQAPPAAEAIALADVPSEADRPLEPPAASAPGMDENLQKLRSELQSIRALLDEVHEKQG